MQASTRDGGFDLVRLDVEVASNILDDQDEEVELSRGVEREEEGTPH